MSQTIEDHGDRRHASAGQGAPAAFPDLCMHQLFAARAQQTPDAVALVFQDQVLSYRELDAKANQLAHYLHDKGIGRGALVGIALERRPELIVAILATLKAGAAYVPIDPSYPQQRLAAMMDELDLALLLTRQALLEALPPHRAGDFCLDRDWHAVAARSSAPPDVAVSPDDLAYVIFTSGSTGRAKAAAVYHRGWVNLMAWFSSEFSIGSDDRVLLVSSFSFDITQRGIMMALIVGGQLHLLPSGPYDAAQIRDAIGAARISLLNCAPSTFYPLVEHGGATLAASLASLRILFLGGEAISASRLRDWAEAPGCRTEVVNVYGAAECSDVSSFYRLRDYPEYIAHSVPIGQPIFNTDMYLLDEDLRPVPAGAAGEICIAGAGLGHGYVNDAAMTAAKFVSAPLGRGGAAVQLYRTGDLGRMQADHNFTFAGRLDHQVKLRGQRIDLGDIEASLRNMPEVREAVLVKKAFGDGDERLLAFLVLRAAPAAWPAALDAVRQQAKLALPQHMVPGAFTAIEQLPLSPNGKIDRNALLALADAPADAGPGPQDLPRNDVEARVALIFGEVLKTARVGVHDNFFDLGGHSSLMTEVLALINEEFPPGLNILQFLSAPTVAAIAERIALEDDVAA